MAKVLRTLRNHWKKSILGGVVLAYGANYAIDELKIGKDMRIVCEKAVEYGDIPAMYDYPKKITVILNPAANKRKAKKNFENYCAPLLHLAGMYVSVVETETEGHGRDIVAKLDPQTEAIIVAGGDGTLSEVITGLMRHQGEVCKIPIGVLPLGKTNTLAQRLFGPEICNTYNGMANATMAVIKGNTKLIDAIRIEIIQENDEPTKAPVYGLAGIEWGLWRQIKKREEALWFLGPLNKYASLIFHGNALQQEVTANIRYSKPCSGCSQCFKQRPDLVLPASHTIGPKRWWNILSMEHRRLQMKEPSIDYSQIQNSDCSVVEELVAVKTSELSVLTSNNPTINMEDTRPHILMTIAPKIRYQGELLFDGVKALQEGGKPVAHKLEAKQIEIRPQVIKEVDEENLSIDNEDYEVRPIRVTVLPNAVKVFSPKER